MRARRSMRMLCLIHAIGCVATVRRPPSASLARVARLDEKLPLVVTLASDKNEYALGEAITFTVTVTNPGTEPVTYFDDPSIGFPNPGHLDLLDFSPVDEPMWQGHARDKWFAEPDGTRNHIVRRLPGGYVSENTDGAEFITVPPGGDFVRIETMSAKVAGCWTVAAELHSWQNYLVRDHHPYPGGSYGYVPKTPEEAARQAAVAEKLSIEELRREREIEAQGWRWNDEREWREKVEPSVTLGTARSNEIEITVQEAE